MVKKADIGSKRLISLSPNQWLKWVTNIEDAESREILSAEFQWLSRDSDVLTGNADKGRGHSRRGQKESSFPSPFPQMGLIPHRLYGVEVQVGFKSPSEPENLLPSAFKLLPSFN